MKSGLKRCLGAISAALVVTLVGACAGGGDDPVVSGSSGPEGEGLYLDGEFVIPQDLWDEARAKPGVLYTTVNEDVAAAVLARFKEDTGVTLELVRAQSNVLYERILAEHGAGRLPADVISLTDLYVPQLSNQGIIVRYDLPMASQIREDLRDPENRWYASDISPISIVYNNQIVSGDQVPTSWKDLVEPGRFDGVGAVDPGAGGGFAMAMFQRKVLGADYWTKHAALGDNLHIYNSHATLAQELARGEISIGPVTASTLTQMIKDGAPLSIANLSEGTPAISSYVGVTDGGTNPAAGRAFMNWLFSRQGMTFAATEHGKFGVRSDVPVPASPDPAQESPALEKLWTADVTEYAELQEEWTREWYELYGLTATS